MNIAGVGKILLWLAPVLLAMVVIILSLQNEQKKEIAYQVEEFDKQFAQMSKEMSLDSDDKEFWKEEKAKAQNNLKQKEIELQEQRKKNNELFMNMEKELHEAEINSIIENTKKDKK